MKLVFADALYWIAIVRPGDSWAEASKRARSALGPVRIVTTDEVLAEFLAALSAGEHLRQQAAKMVRAIHANVNVKVHPQSRDSFLRGLERYENRKDKEYSLVDCISMNAMDAESINEVLTNDHHFTQEGYRILITR